MKSKSLISIALIGVSCIALSVSFLMGAKTHQDDFSLVRSQGNEYTLTYTANDFYQIGCFNDADNRYTNQFAFFPLKYSGNCVALNDYSASSGTFGNGHIYSKTLIEGYSSNMYLMPEGFGDGYHYDAEKTQEVNCPAFAQLTKVIVTLGNEHTLPFDASHSRWRYFDHVEQIGNQIIIEDKNIADRTGEVAFFQLTPTAEQAGEKIVIDQISITYTCTNA